MISQDRYAQRTFQKDGLAYQQNAVAKLTDKAIRLLPKAATNRRLTTVKLEVQLRHRLPPPFPLRSKGGGRRWNPGIGSSGNTK